MISSFDGQYAFLSNFWPANVLLDGRNFPTVEHAYQAAKTMDHQERDAVARMRSAGGAKRVGRTLTLRADWAAVKMGVMQMLLEQKFNDRKLCGMLLATEPHELVEGNLWGDTFWGVCKGEGENHLGRLLMLIRSKSASCVLV